MAVGDGRGRWWQAGGERGGNSLHIEVPGALLPPRLQLYNHFLGSHEPISSILLFTLFGFCFLQ